ncbi:MAG: flavodoxin family protein, partial [Actinomycetia bacterium]|nr:flavodoxin family protein [Actinomycetes bacterium]
MNLTLIEGSPRRGGNTATLAVSLARQLQRSGSAVQRFSVAEQHFAPCTGCNACLDTGECVQRSEGDATGELYAALDTCDALLWVTPLYFAGVPAQLKALIDRFQIYYGRRLADGGAGEPGGQAPWSHISCRS